MSKKKSIPLDHVSINPVYLSARSAIVEPEQAIPVTIYSLKKWLPRLGAGRWSLVQLLRGLSFESQRRPDGTKRVTVSWRSLAAQLQVHEETIASWLKHEPIPGDKPWRRILSADDYAQYLSLFIPRLRYAYETKNGKTRRVGFLLEILMEDPVSPEDQTQLDKQVELLQMQQGELGLNIYGARPVNQQPSGSLTMATLVNQAQDDLVPTPNLVKPVFTQSGVNRVKSDLHPPVKQYQADLSLPVDTNESGSPRCKSDSIATNVKQLESLITDLLKFKHQTRNYQQIFEPIVKLTEQLLNDYHSTAMLYKVLNVLYPAHVDVFIASVEQALLTEALDPQTNKGAIFVSEVRNQADVRHIDLGFRNKSHNPEETTMVYQTPVNAEPTFETSMEEVVWSEVLVVLRSQMTKGMYDAVMRGTVLSSIDEKECVIIVPSETSKAWLENRLHSIVSRALSNVLNSVVTIKFILAPL